MIDAQVDSNVKTLDFLLFLENFNFSPNNYFSL
jgi:hypothetical protein